MLLGAQRELGLAIDAESVPVDVGTLEVVDAPDAHGLRVTLDVGVDVRGLGTGGRDDHAGSELRLAEHPDEGRYLRPCKGRGGCVELALDGDEVARSRLARHEIDAGIRASFSARPVRPGPDLIELAAGDRGEPEECFAELLEVATLRDTRLRRLLEPAQQLAECGHRLHLGCGSAGESSSDPVACMVGAAGRCSARWEPDPLSRTPSLRRRCRPGRSPGCPGI